MSLKKNTSKVMIPIILDVGIGYMVLSLSSSLRSKSFTQNEEIELPQKIYFDHLKTINGVKFTSREIDIIAFFVNGRSTKKIASFFSLSSKTIESHTSNIMQKLNCNSRENVIDFVEKNFYSPLLRKYHDSLLTQNIFECSLKNIAVLIQQESLHCLILCWSERFDLYVQQLAKHLEIAGIKTTLQMKEEQQRIDPLLFEISRKKYDHILMLLPKKSSAMLFEVKIFNTPKTIFLLDEDSEEMGGEKFNNENAINYNIEILRFEKYYSSVFSILKQLLPTIDIENIQSTFTSKNAPPDLSVDNITERKVLKTTLAEKIRTKELIKIPHFYFFLTFLIISSALVFLFFTSERKENSLICSDMIVPVSYHFLERPELLAEIDKALKGQQGIQMVALVGIGGSGKTILSRCYAKQKKGHFIWEIDAETHSSLTHSFEKIAYAFCKTAEDHKQLKGIRNIQNIAEREEKILLLVKHKLRAMDSWILVYDNVEKFTDIQQYIPLDANTWGNGKVILTTSDSNIKQNKHITHSINVKELTAKEKIILFVNILNDGKASHLSDEKKGEIEKFMKKIPSFPLDVSVAASYLKSTDVSYDKYLENLQQYGEEFAIVQKNILKESGSYLKTRYSIITSSLSPLLKIHKDFGMLMLLITLLESRNIPRNLLEHYQDNVSVDNFIYHLKRFSLMTSEVLPSSGAISSLAMHRSTQEISLAYLVEFLKLEKNSPLLCSMLETFADYVNKAREEDNFELMKLLVAHCERLLFHKNLLNDANIGIIKGVLGPLYVHLGNSIKAREFLEESFAAFYRYDSKNTVGIAQVSAYLGNAYRDSGDYKKARELFEKSFFLYKTFCPKANPKLAWASVHLGKAFASLGDYLKAKDLIEQSLVTYEKNPVKNQIKIAWTLAYLASVYNHLGQYQKAKDVGERGLLLSQQFLPPNHPNIALTLVQLGKTYSALGNDKKAKETIEQGLDIYRLEKSPPKIAWSLRVLGESLRRLGDIKTAQKLTEESLFILNECFPNNRVAIDETSMQLGKIYKDLGDYENAQKIFEHALKTFEEYYGANHINVSKVLLELGQLRLSQGQVKAAETLLFRALRIFQENNHPESYLCLESLAEAYSQKAHQAKFGENHRQKLHLKAADFLKQAAEVVQNHLSMDSPHLTRIKGKLTELS